MRTAPAWRRLAQVAAVVATIILLHELHEQAHALAGKLACGAWPSRDFNAWRMPSDCVSSIPTLAGPLFTYAVIWAGVYFTRNASEDVRIRAILLVLLANPVARLITAAMGGGDEGLLLRAWLQLGRGPIAATCVTLVVGAFTIPPMVIAWRARPPRIPAWGYVLLALAPMVVTGTVLFVAGNRLLAAGVLAEPVIAGAPPLVWVATILSAAVLLPLYAILQGTSSSGSR